APLGAALRGGDYAASIGIRQHDDDARPRHDGKAPPAEDRRPRFAAARTVDHVAGLHEPAVWVALCANRPKGTVRCITHAAFSALFENLPLEVNNRDLEIK